MGDCNLSLIQARSLELLVAFDEYCRRLGVSWFMGGGTLLGAARHRGFIPWDDDVDVVMMRADYDRFVAAVIANPPEGTYWESMENHPSTPHMHGKLCSKATDVIALEHPMLDISHTLGIDVFVFDDLPKGAFRQFWHYRVSYACKHLPLLLWGGASGKFRIAKSILRFMLKPFFTLDGIRWAFRHNAVTNCGKTVELACFCGKYDSEKERFDAAWFDSLVPLDFEGRKFPAPVGYREMLARQYGDNYMTPVKVQEAHYRVRAEIPSAVDFSLCVATCGRVAELGRFFESLARQKGENSFEVIVVDQNGDDRLKELVSQYSRKFKVVWLRQEVPNVSRARNAAMEAAKGRYVAFPDDDCVYADDALAQARAAFETRVQMDGFIADAKARKSCMSSRYDVFVRGETWRMFFRRAEIQAIRFDPAIGPGEGNVVSGGEDTDFALKAIERGLCLWREKSVAVVHEGDALAYRNRRRARKYSIARMELLRRHHMPFWFKIANVCYPLARIPLESPRHLRYRLAMFRGRLVGLFRSAAAASGG